ncbi:MAG: 50S ribosomal protein L3 [Candidatus Dojkabacteria bacterium]
MIILGTKQGMINFFTEDGASVAATVISFEPNVVVGTRSLEKDGYSAVILGMGKKKSPNRAEQGKYKKLGYTPQFLVEHRVETSELPTKEEINQERELNVKELVGKKISVTGVTKGKGFQGVVKRWGFKGGPKTHGQKNKHRHPGSIGAGTTPGRVLKGKKMAGRMGTERKTVENSKILMLNPEEKTILVKGPIPGPKNSLVEIKILR